MSFGYGVLQGEGGTNWWHTALQYSYGNVIQTASDYVYRIYNSGATNIIINILGLPANKLNSYESKYYSNGNWNWSYYSNNNWNLLSIGTNNIFFLNNEKNIHFSRGGYSGGSFGGLSKIDEVFITKKAISEPSITAQYEQSIYGNSEGLVAYYSFDNDVNNKTMDSINKNYGSLMAQHWLYGILMIHIILQKIHQAIQTMEDYWETRLHYFILKIIVLIILVMQGMAQLPEQHILMKAFQANH
ncbi:MAG: hypothetical protein PHN56_03970 [Candidatus Nanoarchaeia archaeon]|nr:hypothetical protein [Candidatus Nanoarchaeia archaeon]